MLVRTGWVGLPILVAVLLFSTCACGQAQRAQTIKVLTLLGKPLPLVVAETHGIFAKYGIDVKTENLPNSDVLRANLAAGKGDLAYLAVDNAVAMGELAHQGVILVMGRGGAQN